MPVPTATVIRPTATTVGAPTATPFTGSSSSGSTPTAAGQTQASSIQNFALDTLTISVSTTVTWTNKDTVSHTATSGAGSPDGVWDSGFLSQSQKFSHTFDQVGVFVYYCSIHPDMTGTITVQ